MRACVTCGEKGLVKVSYTSGEPFDIAVCGCVNGEPFRRGGEALVRSWLALPTTHRVAWLEDFDEVPTVMSAPDFLQAAKTRRVKL